MQGVCPVTPRARHRRRARGTGAPPSLPTALTLTEPHRSVYLVFLSSALVLRLCRNKEPQTGGFRTTEVYAHSFGGPKPVMETSAGLCRRPRLQGGARLASPSLCRPPASLACRCIAQPSVSALAGLASLRASLSKCSSSHKDVSHWLGVRPNAVRPHFLA